MSMSQRKEGESRTIPKFRDEAEAAAFWDTHSPLDYPEEFEEVEITFARPVLKRGLTVKLDQATIDELRAIGQEQGVGPSTLARMWILEHLRAEVARRSAKSS
jgi:hypothetical protein